MTNTTCLCTDQTFAGLTQACVLENCTVKDSLSKPTPTLATQTNANMSVYSLDAGSEHRLWCSRQESADEI